MITLVKLAVSISEVANGCAMLLNKMTIRIEFNIENMGCIVKQYKDLQKMEGKERDKVGGMERGK